MIRRKLIFLLLIDFLASVQSKCIWYDGIRDGLNALYLNGEPKELPLGDIELLNEMCPHIPTTKGRINKN